MVSRTAAPLRQRARCASLVWRHERRRGRAHDAARRLLPRARRSGPAASPPLAAPPLRGGSREAEPGDLRWACSTASAAGSCRTREVLNTPIEDLVRGPAPARRRKRSTAVEEALLAADMGLPAVCRRDGGAARAAPARSPRAASPAMREALRDELRRALERPAHATPFSSKPWVVFMVGVNGAGKTTTIGKLAVGLARRGPLGAAVRGRHVPRGRRRAARGVGRSGPARPSTAAPRAPTPPRCSRTPCARRARAGNGRGARRHRRAASTRSRT